MSPTHDPIPESIGRYRTESLLGEGGMGKVYKAFDPALDRFVAIKTISSKIHDDNTLGRLYREARACGRLDHPGIVRVYDVNEEHRFIAMEYLEGETLEAAIQNRRLSFQQQLHVLIDILDALGYAHTKGVVHRDVKPTNVFLLSTGGLKILDFGIARIEQSDSLTVTGTVMGTTYYMSPEQMKGLPVDERTDVYSTGVVAYELFTRRKPFDGKGITDVMLKVLSEEPPPMQAEWSGQFPELEQIVARAMTKAPLQRFSSAFEMKTALQRFLERHHDAIASARAVTPPASDGRTVILPHDDSSGGASLPDWRQLSPAAASGTISFPFDDETRGESRRAQSGTPAPLPPSPQPGLPARMPRWMVPAAVVALISVGAIVAAQKVLAPNSEPKKPVVGAPDLVQPEPIQPAPVQPEPVQPEPIDPDPIGTTPVNPIPTPIERGRQTGTNKSGVSRQPLNNQDGVGNVRGAAVNRSQGRAGLFIDRKQIDGALATELSNALGARGLTMASGAGSAEWEIVSARVDVSTRPAPFGQTSGITADYVASVTIRNAATREQKTERIEGHALEFGEPVARAAALRRAAEEMAQAIEQTAR